MAATCGVWGAAVEQSGLAGIVESQEEDLRILVAQPEVSFSGMALTPL